MASTVAHALCGVTCLLAAAATRPGESLRVSCASVATFALLANLPDIDFVIGYLLASDAHAFHQGATHSFAFAVVSGALLALLFRPYPVAPTAAFFILTILSHAAVDMLTGPTTGLHPSPGIPLWLPFASGMVSAPVTVFLGIQHQDLEHLFSLHNVTAMVREAAIFLPLMMLAYLWAAKKRRLGAP